MARALQCPSCGTTTRIDGVGSSSTFQCEQCGQVLKVPPGLGRAPGSPARPAATVPVGADGGGRGSIPSAPGAPPAPRRRRPVMTAGSGAGGGTAVLSAAEAGVPAPPVVVPPPLPSVPAPAALPRRERLPFLLRVLAWVVAVPLGLAIVGIPARKGGYLSSQKLLDVIVKHSLSRFVPLAVIVALWALVSAVLVTVFVEGGRWLSGRRRSKQGRAASTPARTRSAVAGRRGI